MKFEMPEMDVVLLTTEEITAADQSAVPEGGEGEDL